MLGFVSSLLPALPALPTPSLPQSIQRRLLSFLLRRAVGTLVEGGLDPEQIEADLAQGSARVSNLQLSSKAIGELLGPAAVEFRTGTIASVHAQVSTPLSLSSSISVEVSGIDVVLATVPEGAQASSPTASTPRPPPRHDDDAALDESIVSLAVASEFVHQELDAREDAAVRASLHAEHQAVPGSFDSEPSTSSAAAAAAATPTGDNDEEVTMLAGLIDRILAQLSVKVSALNVTLVHDDNSELALEVPEIRFDTESTSDRLTVTRSMRIAPPSVHLRTRKMVASPRSSSDAATLRKSSSSSSSSSSSGEYTSESQMVMSQAIHDLRSSTASLSSSAGASMYASAVGSPPLATLDEDETTPSRPDPRDLFERPVEDDKVSRRVLGFLAGDIVLTMSKTRPPDSWQDEPAPPRRKQVDIRLEVGELALAMGSGELGALSRLVTAVAPRSNADGKSPQQPKRMSFSASLSLLHVVLCYDPAATTFLDSYWSNPLHPKSACLRGRFEQGRLRLNEEGTCASFGDFSVIEDVKGGKSLPLLVADANLATQYDLSDRTELPGIECSDWYTRREHAIDGRAYRTKQRRSRSSQSTEPSTAAAAVEFRLDGGGGKRLTVRPLHVFCDLAIIQRLQTFVSSLTSVLPRSGATKPAPASSHSTPRPRTPKTCSLDVDVDTALSDLTLEPIQVGAVDSALLVDVDLLRVHVRCPPPSSSSVPEDSVRSGRLIVDIHALALASGSDDDNTLVRASASDVLVFLTPPTVKSVKALMRIASHSAVAQRNEHPFLTIRRHPQLVASTTSVQSSELLEVEACLRQCVGDIDKPTLDCVQLFADDLAQWSSSLSADSATNEEERIVGSRFFGAKSFVQPRRFASDSSEVSSSAGQPALHVRVSIDELLTDLRAPLTGSESGQRDLQVQVADIELQIDLLKNDRNETYLQVSGADCVLHDKTAAQTLVRRTCVRSVVDHPPPLFLASISSAVEPETDFKESKIVLKLVNATYYVTPELSWLNDLLAMIKTPAGAFETVTPNELTRIRAHLVDSAVMLCPSKVESRALLYVGKLSLSSDIVSVAPRTTYAFRLHDVGVMLADAESDLVDTSRAAPNALKFYTERGFVKAINLSSASIDFRHGNGSVLPIADIDVTGARLHLSMCADSLSPLLNVLSDASSWTTTREAPQQDVASDSKTEAVTVSDLFASVDEAAFLQAPTLADPPEMLRESDVPQNERFLASGEKRSSRRGESTSHYRLHDPDARSSEVISDLDGEVIRMHDPKGLDFKPGYLRVPRSDLDDASKIAAASTFRCRFVDCSLDVALHEGYDWPRVRQAIEEQARRTRKQLEKIRQLLASGQAADATGEDASILMYGSVHLGLPSDAAQLPKPELIAALEKELEDLPDFDRDETATQASLGSWQSFPAGSARAKPRPSKRGRRRLTRSSASVFDVHLRGLRGEYSQFPSTHDMSSRTEVAVDSLEMIDNIKTSTWHKFLTELRAGDGGIVRPTGVSMIRFEMKKVRLPNRDEDEIVMKAKTYPLRLYVDQDALDFLKAFAAFREPAPIATADDKSAPLPFFQRVEIMPVMIKLDYKPKRVDFRALRKGRTIELMNFFHFEGSEMVLRHLIVNGITGGDKLSELIQDIWTPDVKANQLADVISGIAPVRSLVNVGTGMANLVLLPMEQYKKDGRIVRGLQKGAAAFARGTALEAIKVGAQLATGTQVILEQAERVIGANFSSPITTETVSFAGSPPPDDFVDVGEQEAFSRYASQPGDIREGIESAYKSLGENFRSAAQTILAVPMEVYERSGSEGPVRSVVRAVPVAVLRPMIGASGAVSKTLLGLRNSLDPSIQAELLDKYKPTQ